jgi:hypothetical protein
MKPVLLSLCLLSMLFLAGCEELALFGGGVAATETFEAWQANLEAKKAELQQQYAAVLAELQTAPDPNAIRLAKEKLSIIADQQLVNEGALLAVKAVLEIPGPGTTPDDQRDFYVALLAGGGAWLYEFLTKRKINTKYVSAKIGQAQLKLQDPAAEAKLYALIGEERVKRGL